MNEENKEVISVSLAETVTRGEIDIQIETAKRWPRSIKKFVDEATQMATLNEGVAQSCIYALPPRKGRDGKSVSIEGPSVRLGEIIASAWGNCRAAVRVVSEDDRFVVAQGAFFDLERNVAITTEVRRRITDSQGRRYSDDMVSVTANAACSIALRNAIFKGVPKAFWEPIYAKSRQLVAGTVQSLATTRQKAILAFAPYGITEAQICEALGVGGVADITLDNVAQLRGIFTAIKEGEVSPEDAFPAVPDPDRLANKGAVIDIPQEEPAKIAAREPGEDSPEIVTGAGSKGVPLGFEQPKKREEQAQKTKTPPSPRFD
ncbi:MAG: hypothetical protein KGL39_50375 [Patescibacteria group bacterium]|nr:hypothetical protein [Patescibacteria group bacterium]